MSRKTWLWWGVLALLVLVAAIGWHQWPARVEVDEARRGEAVEAVYATGAVEPSVQVPVAPRTGARLASWEVDEGAQVRKGQVLARLEAPDLERTVQEVGARERLARANLERTQRLVNEQFLSPAELDRTRVEWEAAQAGLRRAEAQRDYNVLIAPADGVVLRRDGERGQFIPAGQTLYTLACCAPLRVSAEVDEEDIARVRVGMPVVMRTDALPNQVFDGEVAEITPKGDPVTRSYRVRIRFKDPVAIDALGKSGLRVGMTMDANLIISRSKDALLVPTRALRGQQLWVMDEGRVRSRGVVTGVKGTARTEVRTGLRVGEQVVISATDKLRDGQRARVISGAASAP